MPEVLGEAAVYFDPRDPADISKTIKQTLNNRELLTDLRKKGIAQAAKYSWKKMAEETLELYEKVADGK
jgi:glycosyltransferase involved in cell wall biosynthesis